MTLHSLLTIGFLACGESSQNAQKEVSPQTVAQVESLFMHYEQLRILLVNDQTDGYTESLNGLMTKCAEVSAIKQCEEIIKVAKAIQSNGLSDLEKARQSFGDLSKSMVGIASDVPAMKSKLRLFTCPMAQDYPNWIQPTAQLENPYMGQRMLKCGKAIEWSDL